MLSRFAASLRLIGAGLRALHQGARAVGEGVIAFFSVLPSALACGAADTMAAHGRDPNAGLALAFDFEASDDEWDEEVQWRREAHSFHMALSGIYPTQPQHLPLYRFARQGRHHHHG